MRILINVSLFVLDGRTVKCIKGWCNAPEISTRARHPEWLTAVTSVTGLLALPKPYRIYTIGSDGKFAGLPQVMECADDEDAVAKAMQTVDGHDLEIWDMARLVARLPRNTPKG